MSPPSTARCTGISRTRRRNGRAGRPATATPWRGTAAAGAPPRQAAPGRQPVEVAGDHDRPPAGRRTGDLHPPEQRPPDERRDPTTTRPNGPSECRRGASGPVERTMRPTTATLRGRRQPRSCTARRILEAPPQRQRSDSVCHARYVVTVELAVVVGGVVLRVVVGGGPSWWCSSPRPHVGNRCSRRPASNASMAPVGSTPSGPGTLQCVGELVLHRPSTVPLQ